MTGSAAIAATGTIGMSWAKVGAEQNLGVRAIAVNRRGGASGAQSVNCTTVNNTAVAGEGLHGNQPRHYLGERRWSR